ncbi:unnamed protein product [Ilex paraguariensis]|uniref:Uncharacterized protein n=1 Tax=Ilex paraguariensis TaxID=185542 RepID=A0ABC8QQT1_9AQUA
MQKTKKTDHKQEKNRVAVKMGGGGIAGGIFLVGGALAIATLVSGFAIRKRRQRSTSSTNNNQLPRPIPTSPPNKVEENNKDEGSKGLHLLVPDSSPTMHHHLSNGSAKTGVAPIDSKTLISSQILILSAHTSNLIQDEKPKLEINGGKQVPTHGDEEIIFPNGPKQPESSPLLNDFGTNAEEFSFPLADSPSIKPENLKKNESEEEIEVLKEEEETETLHADQTTVDVGKERGEDETYGYGGETVEGNFEEMSETASADQMEAELQFREDPENPTNVNQEIVSSESSVPKSSLFKNYDGKVQELPLPEDYNSNPFKPENVNKNDSIKGPLSQEAVEVMEEDEGTAAGHADQGVAEDDPQMHSIEDEQKQVAETHHADQFAVKDDKEFPFSEDLETLSNIDQGNFCSDKSMPESSLPENFGADVQEFSFPVLESPLPSPEDVNKNVSTKASLLMGALEVLRTDEAIEAAGTTQTGVEYYPPMQTVEKEQIEDYGDDNSRGNTEERGDNACEQEEEEEENEDSYDDDDGEVTVKKCEEAAEPPYADQLAVKDDQQIQSNQEQETLLNNDQENFCCYTSVPESSSPKNYGANLQEFSFPVLESTLPMREDVNGKAPKEAPLSLKSIRLKEEDETTEAASTTQTAIEYNHPTQLVEEQNEDYANSDGRGNTVEKSEDAIGIVHADMVATEDNPKIESAEEEESSEDSDANEQDYIAEEKIEEGSDGTGASSMESNSEAIWPVESMQKLLLDSKELEINKQALGETIEADRTVNKDHIGHNRVENGNPNDNGQNIIEDDGKSTSNFSQMYMIQLAKNNEESFTSKWRIWIWSSFMPLWFLAYWYFGLPFVKICLIVVLSVMLFKYHEV